MDLYYICLQLINNNSLVLISRLIVPLMEVEIAFGTLKKCPRSLKGVPNRGGNFKDNIEHFAGTRRSVPLNKLMD